MNNIEWKRYYDVGIVEIDSQHKQLVDILNKLIQAKNKNSDENTLRAILQELVDHTQAHFVSEELHMRKNNYPLLDDHIQLHKFLINRFIKMIEKINDGNLEIGNELFERLKYWLLQHVLEEDREYGYYLKEN